MNTITNPARLRAALLLALLLIPLAGCGDDPTGADAPADEHAGGEEHGDEHAEGEADEVTMSVEAMRTSGVVVAAARTMPLAETFSAPARVVPGLTGSAHVGPLVPGRVVRLMAGEGTAVRRGSPLAEVESMEVADLQGDYLTTTADVARAGAEIARADAEVERAQVSLARHEQLAAEDLIPRDKLDEVRQAYRTAQASRTAAQASRSSALAVQSAARTKLATLGLGAPTGRGSAARFVVRSPIGGTVTARGAQIGEYVEPSRDMFEVAASGSSTVEAQVSPAQAEGLRVGQLATVVTGDSARFAGRVVSVSPAVDAESRTVPVRIEMVGGRLRPEAFATVEFEAGRSRSAVVVPNGAVERADGGTFVFAEVDGELQTFVRTELELGQSTGDGVEVRAGLATGRRIVTEGVFYLRSARQRGELAEHDH